MLHVGLLTNEVFGMEIRLSQYNAPFGDFPNPDIHYISLEDQRLAQLGFYYSHVWLYYRLFWESLSLPTPYRRSTRQIEIYDPLSNTTSIHEINSTDFSYSAFTSESEPADDIKFLDELYYKHGIKTAGKRIGRYD